jgi:osmotically-inducible protein OsmY
MDERQNPTQFTDSPQIAEEDEVAREVARAVTASGRSSANRVQVSASDGVVTLRGRVTSYYQKQVAQAAALTVIGDRRLVNEVHVD